MKLGCAQGVCSTGDCFGGDDVATAAALAAMEAVSREELAAKRAAKKAAFNTEYDAGVRSLDFPHFPIQLVPQQCIGYTFLDWCDRLGTELAYSGL